MGVAGLLQLRQLLQTTIMCVEHITKDDLDVLPGRHLVFHTVMLALFESK